MGQRIGIFALGGYGELGQDYLSRTHQKYVAAHRQGKKKRELITLSISPRDTDILDNLPNGAEALSPDCLRLLTHEEELTCSIGSFSL
jgi:hypothetical protein